MMIKTLTKDMEVKLRKILDEAGCSVHTDSVIYEIKHLREKQWLPVNLLLVFFSLEEILNSSYDKKKVKPLDEIEPLWNPLDESRLSVIKEIYFLMYLEVDDERRENKWKNMMKKIKDKIRNVKKQEKDKKLKESNHKT